MTNPTGYTELDLVGFTDKGEYSPSANYVQNDIVQYNYVAWRCKVDDTTGITPTEGANWTVFVGNPSLNSVTGVKGNAESTYRTGNVNISPEDLGAVKTINNAGAHNAIYRGKALGSSVTSAQYNAIDAGTFEDLYIGDYWTINRVNYRIAAFDYWLHCGDTECITHHVVIVPDTCLEIDKKMNDSNVTTGGYPGSKMYGTGVDHSGGNLEGSVNIIKTAFGNDHLLVHREYIANAVSNGRPSAGAWMDSKVDLMNEHMVYGGKFFEVTSDGSTIPKVQSTSKSQLALFRLDPSRITNRVSWWLRDPVSAANFANVGRSGDAYAYSASTDVSVRPAFAIYKP